MRTSGNDEALARVVREEWGRLIALLLARYRRLDLVEDALGDAVEAAARAWPAQGVPDNPAAWLHTVAGRRVLDRLRAEAMHRRRAPLLTTETEHAQERWAARADPGGLVEDDVLRLVLMCTHPALAPESASALTLRLVLGVSTYDVARLFLIPEPTMAARITRAKKKIVAAGIPFSVPGADALPDRLDTVAQTAYLAFTAGYARGQAISLPIAHHDGNYVCSEDERRRLEDEDRIVFRYRDNPNGSTGRIAGVLGAGRNVLGMMPHPERAADARTGGTDGAILLQTLVETLH